VKSLNKFLWSSVPNVIKIGEKHIKYEQNPIYAHTTFTASFIKITSAQQHYIVTRVYQIALQLVEKYGTYVKKSIYTPKKSMSDTKPSFDQLILAR
jgi:hypothetical protein